MATIPIYGRFVGDFTAHLVAVDTEDTIDEVAVKIARHVVGRRLRREAGRVRYTSRARRPSSPSRRGFSDISDMPLRRTPLLC